MNRLPWWVGGILLSALLLMTFSVFGADRPIGASTYVPYFAGLLFDLDFGKYTYLKEIENAGAWEGVMLFGMMIIGARLAGGCTSGHFLSGMSQMAISAMIFGVVVMVTLVITGRLFYNVKEK